MRAKHISGVTDKETRKLLARLRKAGATIETTSGNHIRITGPGGGVVIGSCTTSDHRSLLNLKAYIRRAMPEVAEALK